MTNNLPVRCPVCGTVVVDPVWKYEDKKIRDSHYLVNLTHDITVTYCDSCFGKNVGRTVFDKFGRIWGVCMRKPHGYNIPIILIELGAI